MVTLSLGQIAEELPGRSIADLGGGPLIKVLRLSLHRLGVTAHRFNAESLNHPNRLPANESLHIFPANERDVIAESAPVFVDQLAAMRLFFGLHLFEDLGRGCVVSLQAGSEVGIDAAVCFLRGDCEGKDLRL